VVFFIGKGNRSTYRKPLNCDNQAPDKLYYLMCYMYYNIPRWSGIELIKGAVGEEGIRTGEEVVVHMAE
jgi:hypothetical protein